MCADSHARTASDTIPDRASVPEQARWNLEAIYPTFEAWEAAFNSLEPRIDALADFSGTLNRKNLSAFLKEDEAVTLELERLYVYANMKSHEDLRLSRPMELAARAETLMTRYAAATAFFSPEVLALPEEDLRQWLAQDEALRPYEFFFEKILRERPHVLSGDNEKLLARSRELSAVPSNAFTLLTDADLQFPSIRDEHGNESELTEERWYRFSRSLDRNVRKAAFLGIHGTYGKFKNAIGALYAGSVRGDIFYSQARHYKTSLERALFAENVPESVYDNVIRCAERSAPLMHRLVSLRRRVLKLDRLHYYDLNVPLSPEPMTDSIPWDEACRMTSAALEPLGRDYVTAFNRGLSDRWADVYENQGKRKGAYSWGSYGTHPYVLLNYNGTLRDVFTLAHEMGHALHSWHSNAAQPQVYADYTILAAEAASTTNEMLLLGWLLDGGHNGGHDRSAEKNKEQEANERKWLLNYYYDMVRTTFFRQAMFADFELKTHEHSEAGNALTPEWMSELWRGLNAECYGPEFEIDPELCVEWARIPHFYTAFYVYKYVTGFVAANVFSSAVLNGEEGAVERYLTFLKSGGSDYPLNIFKRAGVDLTRPEPFERAMALFEARLSEGERLWGA